VRASYDTLIFSDPHTYREIYGTHANVQKAWHFGVWPKDRTAVSTFAVQDKYEHRRRRRNLDYAFSDRAVRSSELYVIEHVDRWGAILAEGSKDGWSDPRDMTAESDHYVFDILCDLCFGWTYETKKPGPNKLKTVPHDVAQYMKFTYQVRIGPCGKSHTSDPDDRSFTRRSSASGFL
jgi:cytochrome P450